MQIQSTCFYRLKRVDLLILLVMAGSAYSASFAAEGSPEAAVLSHPMAYLRSGRTDVGALRAIRSGLPSLHSGRSLAPVVSRRLGLGDMDLDTLTAALDARIAELEAGGVAPTPVFEFEGSVYPTAIDRDKAQRAARFASGVMDLAKDIYGVDMRASLSRGTVANELRYLIRFLEGEGGESLPRLPKGDGR